jgi:DNA-binding transcriptional LysR family regulator
MDRHQAMECFRRIVETGSFAAAARDLNCSRSVVSKYMAFLEAWTQSRLLARTTRQQQLTTAGERFYAYCCKIAAETEGMLQEVAAGHSLSGRLVLDAPVSLTLTTLSPHLLAFQQAYPSVTLDIRLNDNLSDLVRDGVDLALRARGSLDDSSLVATPLAKIERVLCAAPGYWARHGKPATPHDLKQHNCLSYLLASDVQSWEFDREGERFSIDVRGSLRSNNSLMLVEAMLQGVGLALIPAPLVQRHLDSGQLETALDGYHAETRTLYAVYPSRVHLPHKVRALVSFLQARLGPGSGPGQEIQPG